MAIPLDFEMRRVMDARLASIGTELVLAGKTNRRTLDISSYGLSIPSVSLHVGSATSSEDFDDDMIWVQAALIKIPYESVTRGPQGLNVKKSLYSIFVKSSKNYGEYLNEAVSGEIESYFDFNRHIVLDGQVFTILETYQQPSIFLDGDTGRYWNRVFINCEAYYTNN